MTEQYHSRLPPHARDAERSVLGSMLRDNATIDDVTLLVEARHFYADAHQKIFAAIVARHERGSKVDLVILAEDLKDSGQLDDAGGPGYIGELWDAAPIAANASYYARIVRDKFLARESLHICTQHIADVNNGTGPIGELVEELEREVFALGEQTVESEPAPLSVVLSETCDLIDRRCSGGEQDEVVGTGYELLNDALSGGFHAGEFCIIAARPSSGKTGLAFRIAGNIVFEQHPVLFVSLEQPRTELCERLLASEARVAYGAIRKGDLDPEEVERLAEAKSRMWSLPLYIDHAPGQTVSRIAAKARRLKRKSGIRIVIIDYLQFIQPANRRQQRYEQVGEISRGLKLLARDLGLPVVALAQLNRSSEDRKDHRPKLSDLRESGSQEQDADTVLLLHRPEMYEPGRCEGIVEAIIAKQRNGPTGEVALKFDKQYMSFEQAL